MDGQADRGWRLPPGGQTDSEGAGGPDFYVVRTDSEGHELWSRAFGGPATDRAFGIDQTPDGGALVVGFQGENPKTMNLLLLRVDREGQELWRRTLAGDRFDVGHHVLRIAGGGYAVSGYSSSFSAGDEDGFLMRLSDDGRMLWMRMYGDGMDDRVLHAAPMEDGGFALVGYSKPVNGNAWSMVVRRVDEQGSLLWSHRAFGAVGKDIVVGHDGAVIAVGSIRTGPTAYDDILILRIAPESRPWARAPAPGGNTIMHPEPRTLHGPPVRCGFVRCGAIEWIGRKPITNHETDARTNEP